MSKQCVLLTMSRITDKARRHGEVSKQCVLLTTTQITGEATGRGQEEQEARGAHVCPLVVPEPEPP